MKKALVPGSFDPITKGHVAVIKKAASMFDKVYVTVMQNEAKKYLFDINEREELVKNAIAGIKNAEADVWEGQLWQYAEKKGVCAIVKGIRNGKDAEYEINMAEYNKSRYPKAETVLLPADSELKEVSSTLVRGLAAQGKDVSAYVDEKTEKALIEKYRRVKK